MNTLQQLLVSPEIAADLILSGATLAIAGDESVLAALPQGNWIGGTIPYFMGPEGGVTTRDQLFATPLSLYPGLKPFIKRYDTASLSQVCVEAPANGFSVIILPAFSEVHFEYAQHAPMYEDMFMKPLVGWVAGIHLDDMGHSTPKVCDGRTKAMMENQAVVMHVPLPENISANVNIVNLFTQGHGDVIEFLESGFEATTCLVNGKTASLAKYLQKIGHDTRLPLVADYSGANINVSLKTVDAVQDKVAFYGPVFPHVAYRLAQPFSGSYETSFGQAIANLPQQAGFSCNCVLNYLYSGLEGKRTGHVTGPMTFGEIAYVLMNQTMVHLALEAH
ncbi:MAG: hypothetical protein A3F78_18875 [Burkholderiales bacterium RIFCSPLOWO2_12_FULL_61_40]|nr:MAG: hypothetical protein A3F78_18875 [Burkholderiales bacterium RIFCSPLOWO2_12_FULL_61_40]